MVGGGSAAQYFVDLGGANERRSNVQDTAPGDLGAVLDTLTGWISDSPWTYLVVVALTCADILVVVPADAVIIAAVVVAQHGPLWVSGVAAAAVVGAVIGDNILYFLGKRVGQPAVRRLFSSESSRRRLDWATQQMHRHRNLVIIAGRFVPVGRTATMFAAGLLQVPWRRFIVPEITAVVLWVGYDVTLPVLLGPYLPGWATVLMSLVVAVVLAGAAELARRVVERRRGPGPANRR